MESNLITMAIYATAIIVAYAILSRGLFRATEPARQSLNPIADRLLANRSALPERHRRWVKSSLDEVHSSKIAWLLAVLAVLVLFTFPIFSHKSDPAKDIPKSLQADYESFVNRYIIASIGNSLGALFLFGLCVGITVAYARSIKAVSRAILGWHDPDGDGPSLEPQHS